MPLVLYRIILRAAHRRRVPECKSIWTEESIKTAQNVHHQVLGVLTGTEGGISSASKSGNDVEIRVYNDLQTLCA